MSRHKRRRELAKLQTSIEKMRVGHKLGRDFLAASDAAVARTSLPTSMSPMLAMGALLVAKQDMSSLKDVDISSAIAEVGCSLFADVVKRQLANEPEERDVDDHPNPPDRS